MLNFFMRSLVRNKLVSIINLVGLTLGITCATILFLFVKDENSYDQFNHKRDRIYRVAHNRLTNGSENLMATTPLALSPALSPIAGIESKARMLREPGGVILNGADVYSEEQFCFADPEVLKIFSFEFVEGNDSTAFANKGILITEKIARKYFGNDEALGKTLQYRNWGTETSFHVTGVVKDLPTQSHFHFEIFVPFDSPSNLWQAMHGTDWYYSGSAWTYILTNPTVQASDLTAQINQESLKHLPDDLKASTQFFLQPLTSIYLNSEMAGEIEMTGSQVIVNTFLGIGIAILLLGCINYMNLSTARSAERTKEAGIRKVLGAFHIDLVWRYFSETLLLSTMSMLLTLFLVPLCLPLFNLLMGKSLTIDPTELITFVLLVGLAVGLLSGLYPAFYFSKLKPADSLKMSKSFGSSDHADLRKLLVTFQYVITSILLVGIFTISEQMNYVQNKNLGFDAKETLYLQGYDFRKARQVKEALHRMPQVVDATTSWGIQGSQQAPIDQRLLQTDLTTENQRMEAYVTGIDHDYVDFFGMEVVEGRNFSHDFVADSVESILVNETFIKEAGWSEALGKEVEIFNMLGRSIGKRKVVGVLKDFNFQSLHQLIRPLAFTLTTRGGSLAFHLDTNDPLQSIKAIREKMEPFNSGGVIAVYFLDQDLDFYYQKERRFNDTLEAFTYLAILISCIGLFGLASFSAQRKAREIAIRKVLGASSHGLFIKFVGDFCLLVIVSFVIAVPISYYAINEWLAHFTYRITQGPQFYFLALGASLMLSVFTVGLHSMRAASANPVNSLKEE